ncbi:MAG TPA: helix-turn-helix transcriptional regulator [Stellaceae bacterium]|nr:helix-turn-helix transcriptional regulator [Stellaceae bacterium]
MVTNYNAQEAPDGDADYLRRLGERIREARLRRGMTRRILAHDSRVSERYLAQLEGGQGNISIALLRRVAQAMGLPLADLVRDEPDRPIELTLLIETLSRLAPGELDEARRLIGSAFGDRTARDRRQRIALIGLRGAGKSTLGAGLAAALDVPFIELDREVEQAFGTSLGEVFDLYGQAAYRRAERDALAAVVARYDRAVIAAGGSIVAEAATYDLLLSCCFTVWLKAAPEEHMARVQAQGDLRPMAASAAAMADLRRILAGREALYARADATVDTAGVGVAEGLRRLKEAVGAAA